MNLIHWSDQQLRLENLESRPLFDPHFAMKPFGLWVSVGDDEDGWRAWCEDNNFAKGRFRWKHQVHLRDEAKILRITNTAELVAFDAQYATRTGVRWDEVAELYQGILIAPYFWSLRLEILWYYSWDCASGCIWDFEAIAMIDAERFAVRSRKSAKAD